MTNPADGVEPTYLQENIAEVESLQCELEGLADNIENHYRKQLKTHEEDFKKAYECQMQKVRKELQFLQKQQTKANGAIIDDVRITTLRQSIDWFKRKSLELDVQLNKQKEAHI